MVLTLLDMIRQSKLPSLEHMKVQDTVVQDQSTVDCQMKAAVIMAVMCFTRIQTSLCD